MFMFSVNCRTMIELPPELVDVIWFSPGIWPNCRSSGAVTAGGHDVRTRSGVESHNLNRRIINFRKRGNRELQERHKAGQQNRRHQ